MPAAAGIESPTRVTGAIIAARWAAAAIDWALISLVTIISSTQLRLVLWPMPIGAQTGSIPLVGEVVLVAVDVVLGVAYFGLLEGRWGISLGKFFVGLRVTSSSGGPAGFARAAARAGLGWGWPNAASDLLPVLLPNTVSPFGMLTGLVVLAGALFLPARRANGFQAWHDRWTDTRVAFDTRASAVRIRNRVVAASFALACLTLVAGLGAVVLMGLPRHAPDWWQDRLAWGEFFRHAQQVGLALSFVAVLGGFLSLLIGLAVFRMTARAVVTLALAASSMALGVTGTGMLQACCGGNEASAIGALRAINSAESTYSSACAGGGFATDLADLAKPPRANTAAFISPDLGLNGMTRNGYIITLTRNAAPGVTDVGSPATTCNGPMRQPASSYFASAVPVTVGSTGQRSFATDSRGTIFFLKTGVAIANPIPADATALQ